MTELGSKDDVIGWEDRWFQPNIIGCWRPSIPGPKVGSKFVPLVTLLHWGRVLSQYPYRRQCMLAVSCVVSNFVSRPLFV